MPQNDYQGFLEAMHRRGVTDIARYIPASEVASNAIKARQVLLHPGSANQQLFLIRSGLCKIVYSNEDGKEFIRAFLNEDMFYVAYRSFLTGRPTDCRVEAIEDSEVLSVPFHRLYSALDLSLSLNRAWRTYMEQHFIRHERRELSLLSSTATERYQQFLQDYSALESRLPQHLIAAYLGITEQSLSRLRKTLRDDDTS